MFAHPLANNSCRSPYDLGRDSTLWAADAFSSLEEAIENVKVDPGLYEIAALALQNEEERPRALQLVRQMLKQREQEQQEQERSQESEAKAAQKGRASGGGRRKRRRSRFT